MLPDIRAPLWDRLGIRARPVSSIFDFLTFWVMLSLLHAGHAEFRTGWFVESIATQTLVSYVIRTRRVPFFKSKVNSSLPRSLLSSSRMTVQDVVAAMTIVCLSGAGKQSGPGIQ